MIDIDKKEKTVKKIFDYYIKDNFTFLKNEVFWLNYLKSKWVPELLEIGDNYIITRYYGPDCLELYKKKILPDISKQVIDMYRFFKEKNVFKLNGALSNMTLNGNQVVAFDWKWARKCDNNKETEIKSYDKWLVKIDPKLPERLKSLL